MKYSGKISNDKLSAGGGVEGGRGRRRKETEYKKKCFRKHSQYTDLHTGWTIQGLIPR